MSTEVTIHQPKGIVALRALSPETSMELVQAAIAENLGVGPITEFDFDRIKIPAGGETVFRIVTLEGEAHEKAITGVIVSARDARAYWKVPYDQSGGNTPPDCYSIDGLRGAPLADDKPGRLCATCQLAKFGSDPKTGRGQACKALRQLFILRGDSLLPVVLALPPTSLKAARQYMVRLAGQGVPYWSVVTRIGLEAAQNSAGLRYSRATFSFVSMLNEEQREKARAYADMLRPMVRDMTITAADYSVEPDGADEAAGGAGPQHDAAAEGGPQSR